MPTAGEFAYAATVTSCALQSFTGLNADSIEELAMAQHGSAEEPACTAGFDATAACVSLAVAKHWEALVAKVTGGYRPAEVKSAEPVEVAFQTTGKTSLWEQGDVRVQVGSMAEASSVGESSEPAAVGRACTAAVEAKEAGITSTAKAAAGEVR
jgi:hypothetical protein